MVYNKYLLLKITLSFKGFVLLGLLILAPWSTVSAEAGNWFVKGGIGTVSPNDSSGEVTAGAGNHGGGRGTVGGVAGWRHLKCTRRP